MISKPITKAVIPVAGLGTRMLPATKVIPKEMLPIVDKPMIQYVVEEAAMSGITEIVFVTHSSKNSIENHFDTSFELETHLESRLKRKHLDEIRSITPKDISIISVRQAEPKGLGDAILSAFPVIGYEPFAVLLPDVLISEYDCELEEDNLSSMITKFNKTLDSQVMVDEVPREDVDKYGIVEFDGSTIFPGDSSRIRMMVEKPHVSNAQTNMAAVGRYAFSKEIWKILKDATYNLGKEVELTNAIAWLSLTENVRAYRLVGKSYDCGNKSGYAIANIDYAIMHQETSKDVLKHIMKY